jgi:IS5 family transposase
MKRDTCATYPPLNTLKPVTQDISIADGPVIRFGMPWLEMLKRQFGFTQTRYRGLMKNAVQVNMLMGLANLFLLRRRLVAVCGEKFVRCTASGP